MNASAAGNWARSGGWRAAGGPLPDTDPERTLCVSRRPVPRPGRTTRRPSGETVDRRTYTRPRGTDGAHESSRCPRGGRPGSRGPEQRHSGWVSPTVIRTGVDCASEDQSRRGLIQQSESARRRRCPERADLRRYTGVHQSAVPGPSLVHPRQSHQLWRGVSKTPACNALATAHEGRYRPKSNHGVTVHGSAARARPLGRCTSRRNVCPAMSTEDPGRTRLTGSLENPTKFVCRPGLPRARRMCEERDIDEP